MGAYPFFAIIVKFKYEPVNSRVSIAYGMDIAFEVTDIDGVKPDLIAISLSESIMK